jgi:starch phosphorylase
VQFGACLHSLLTLVLLFIHPSAAQSYVATQDQIAKDFMDVDAWMKKCILNVASGGFFSSDRTIIDYSENIWGAEPCPVE